MKTVAADDEADRTADAPHPRHASTLVGHAAQERDLLEAYRHNLLPHAIVFAGPAGVGKATLAWRLARFLAANPVHSARHVAEAADLSVAPGAKAAAEVASLSHPDIGLLRREINEKTKRFYTEIRTDDVRRTIGLFQRGAGADGYRICIVDSAEDLNRSSANALLKLIEEPPPLSLFILVAHRPGLLLPTIRSRCRMLRFEPLLPAEIERVVATLGPPFADKPAATVAAAATKAQGSMRDALRLLGHRGIGIDQTVERLLDALPAIDWREIHKLADQVVGRDGEAAFEATMNVIQDWMTRWVRERAPRAPRQLVPLAEAWDKLAAHARETEDLNLDRRPFVLAAFTDLAAAVRAAG